MNEWSGFANFTVIRPFHMKRASPNWNAVRYLYFSIFDLGAIMYALLVRNQWQIFISKVYAKTFDLTLYVQKLKRLSQILKIMFEA